jgi:hypothetical protein
MHGVFRDLTNRKFGRWTVIARGPNWKTSSQSSSRWFCRCECGTERVVHGAHLVQGRSKSCGCINFRHGWARRRNVAPEYEIWLGMKRRCFKPKNSGYKYYGAKGVTVCQRWLDSFANFMADMGPRPKGMSIERKDSKGNYEPGNCRWATQTEQARNQRDTTMNMETAREIRRLYSTGKKPMQISRTLGVRWLIVKQICLGKTWKESA